MGKLMDWAQKAARMIFRRGDPRRADAPVVEREASTTLTTGGHYAQAQPVDPLLPEAERQRLRQVLLVGTAANRQERRAAIRQVRRERAAPKRRKYEARGRRAYLRAMSARHEGV